MAPFRSSARREDRSKESNSRGQRRKRCSKESDRVGRGCNNAPNEPRPAYYLRISRSVARLLPARCSLFDPWGGSSKVRHGESAVTGNNRANERLSRIRRRKPRRPFAAETNVERCHTEPADDFRDSVALLELPHRKLLYNC